MMYSPNNFNSRFTIVELIVIATIVIIISFMVWVSVFGSTISCKEKNQETWFNINSKQVTLHEAIQYSGGFVISRNATRNSDNTSLECVVNEDHN